MRYGCDKLPPLLAQLVDFFRRYFFIGEIYFTNKILPLLHDDSPLISEQFSERPDIPRYPCLNRWRTAQGFMHVAEVITREVQPELRIKLSLLKSHGLRQVAESTFV